MDDNFQKEKEQIAPMDIDLHDEFYPLTCRGDYRIFSLVILITVSSSKNEIYGFP
jgi:hypothetical protein